jgi:hypothetical protein
MSTPTRLEHGPITPLIPIRTLLLLLALVAVVPLGGCRTVAELEAPEIEAAFEGEIEAGDLVLLPGTNFEDFDALDISSSFEVDVIQGERFEVTVRVSEGILDRVEVAQDGSTLRLGVAARGLLGFRMDDLELEATITMPELVAVDLSGASTMRCNGFASERDLRIDISGASTLDGALSAGDTIIDASGASTVSLAGEGGDLRVDASGASTVDLSDYVVADAKIDASGASNVDLDVRGRLDAEAGGASSVHYGGSPELGSIDTSGAGSVRER